MYRPVPVEGYPDVSVKIHSDFEGQKSMSRYNNWDDEEYDSYEDDEQDVYDEPPRPRRAPATRPRRRRRKQRRVWPWLLAGCAGGIIILVLAAAIVVFLAFRTATNGGNLGNIGGIANPTTYT